MQTVEQKERVFSMSLPWPDQLTMTHLLTWLLRILTLTRTRTLTQEPNNQSRERSILTRSPVMLLLMSLALDLLKISDCTPED
jgi:hypothetical protein